MQEKERQNIQQTSLTSSHSSELQLAIYIKNANSCTYTSPSVVCYRLLLLFNARYLIKCKLVTHRMIYFVGQRSDQLERQP